MTNPGITVLEKCLEDKCRYTLVTMASKRARMIADGAPSLLNENDSENDSKPVSAAVQEIAGGRITYKRKVKTNSEMTEIRNTLNSSILAEDLDD